MSGNVVIVAFSLCPGLDYLWKQTDGSQMKKECTHL